MLQRLRVLQDAAATARPTRLLPHLWLSGAVEANSLHVLRHLGITHVLNATEDLLLPDPDAAFECASPCIMMQICLSWWHTSLHVLLHLGITHVLNATEDLLLQDPDAASECPSHPH
jgi:hypothetical protein